MKVESDYVIHYSEGKRKGKRPVELRKAWYKAIETVGLEGFRFHDLRACAVSNLISAGVTPCDAMQISGHKTDSMLRRYDIVDAERLQRIGQQVEKNVFGKAKARGSQ